MPRFRGLETDSQDEPVAQEIVADVQLIADMGLSSVGKVLFRTQGKPQPECVRFQHSGFKVIATAGE